MQKLNLQSLRLYDVDSSKLRMEAPGEAELLDCCFENERVCFSAASDGSVNRFLLLDCCSTWIVSLVKCYFINSPATLH